jgi:hypothetical protein
MTKKQRETRNHARDMIGDYYMANREVEKENRKRQEAGEPFETGDTKTGDTKKERKAWSSSEKLLLGMIILGLLAIIVKYFVLR